MSDNWTSTVCNNTLYENITAVIMLTVSAYLTSIMVRRVWIRLNTRMETRIDITVRRELSALFPLMVQRIGIHRRNTDNIHSVGEDYVAAPAITRFFSSGVSRYVTFDSGGGGDPFVTTTNNNNCCAPAPAPWSEVLRRDMDNQIVIHSTPLLIDMEVQEVIDRVTQHIYKSTYFQTRSSLRDLVDNAVRQRCADYCHRIIDQMIQFSLLTHRLSMSLKNIDITETYPINNTNNNNNTATTTTTRSNNNNTTSSNHTIQIHPSLLSSKSGHRTIRLGQYG